MILASRNHLDGPLLIALLMLSGLSLIVLYSAGGGNGDLIWRQFIRLSVAILLMVAIAYTRIDSIQRWSPHFFSAGLLLLGLVLLV